jgi:tripartite-type tricarboxylate transporter receptor subunit TctC
MELSRKWRIGLVLTAVLATLIGTPVFADDYPFKPITLIIPFPAGGAVDLTSRALANAAKNYLGQPIICENKAGGGGTVGPSLLITKPADGYTVAILTASPTIAWHMGKLEFNPIEDVTHIARLYGFLSGVVVRADAPWKTMQELIQYAKQNPNKVSYGSPGVGTPTHLAMEELTQLSGIQLIHVPYKGGGEDIPALLGGHVELLSEASGWVPMVDAGKFRLLVTYGQKRSVRYPDIPTLKEIGYDVVVDAAAGLIGPKGLPTAMVQRLQAAFQKATEDPEYQAVLKKMDMSSLYLGPADYATSARQDSERIGKLVTKLGLK